MMLCNYPAVFMNYYLTLSIITNFQQNFEMSQSLLFLMNMSVRIFLVKMTLRLLQPLSVVMTMVPTLLRQLRRSLQIKKIITNLLSINNSKKCWLLRYPKRSEENCRSCTEKEQQLAHMSFIHSESEIRIYRVSIGKKFDDIASYTTA